MTVIQMEISAGVLHYWDADLYALTARVTSSRENRYMRGGYLTINPREYNYTCLSSTPRHTSCEGASFELR